MKYRLLVLLSVIVALGITACVAAQPTDIPSSDDGGDTPPSDGGSAESLAGTAWTLQTIGGEPLLEGSNVTLEFEADNLGGYTGCNSYGGPYFAGEDGSLRISEIARTERACFEPEGVMEQEAAYTEQLHGATAYRIHGDMLTIQGASAELVYSLQQRTDADPAALIGTAWRLKTLNGETLSESYTLAFPAEGQMVGRPACRVLIGTYLAENDSIHFPAQSMIGETCNDLLDTEGRFTDALTWASHYRLFDGNFELDTQQGDTYRFEALDAAPELVGTAWTLLAFAEADAMPAGVVEALPEPPVTLSFDAQGTAGGSGGCNSYGGSYAQDGSELAFGEMVSTMMACADQRVTDQEARYLGELAGVTHFVAVGDVLWLGTAEGGALVFQTTE